jgi:ATP synthase protein I
MVRKHDASGSTPASNELERTVGTRESRKLRARRDQAQSVWFGLGMFGLVGWSVAVPTLLGVAAGVWIDSRWPSRVSWSLTLLFLGVVLGCVNAWCWVNRERQAGGNEADG